MKNEESLSQGFERTRVRRDPKIVLWACYDLNFVLKNKKFPFLHVPLPLKKPLQGKKLLRWETQQKQLNKNH